jgi:competence protein ComGC
MIINQKGFSLVEMLIVLMIITTLLLIAVPNLKQHNTIVNDKSCSATTNLVNAQVETYAIENGGAVPATMSDLKNYIPKIDDNGQLFCPGGEEVKLTDGQAEIVSTTTE